MQNMKLPYIVIQYLGEHFQKTAEPQSPMFDLAPIAEDMFHSGKPGIKDEIGAFLKEYHVIEIKDNKECITKDMEVILNLLYHPAACLKVNNREGEYQELSYYVELGDGYLSVLANKGIATLDGPKPLEQVIFELENRLLSKTEKQDDILYLEYKKNQDGRTSILGIENGKCRLNGTNYNDVQRKASLFAADYEINSASLKELFTIVLCKKASPQENAIEADYEKLIISTENTNTSGTVNTNLTNTDDSKDTDQPIEWKKVGKGAFIALAVNVCLMIVNYVLKLVFL